MIGVIALTALLRALEEADIEVEAAALLTAAAHLERGGWMLVRFVRPAPEPPEPAEPVEPVEPAAVAQGPYTIHRPGDVLPGDDNDLSF